MSVTEKIYQRFPDDSPMDYNKTFDAADAVFDPRGIRHKEIKRLLYRYRDAARSNDIIWNQHEDLTRYLHPNEKSFLRNPVLQISVAEGNEEQKSWTEKMIEESEDECFDAWNVVAGVICGLENGNEKLVLTAHYLCGAKWEFISRVYGKQDRWATELHRRALKKLEMLIQKEETSKQSENGSRTMNYGVFPVGSRLKAACSDESAAEITKIIQQWEKDEVDYQRPVIEEKPYQPIELLDDMRLVMGLS